MLWWISGWQWWWNASLFWFCSCNYAYPWGGVKMLERLYNVMHTCNTCTTPLICSYGVELLHSIRSVSVLWLLSVLWVVLTCTFYQSVCLSVCLRDCRLQTARNRQTDRSGWATDGPTSNRSTDRHDMSVRHLADWSLPSIAIYSTTFYTFFTLPHRTSSIPPSSLTESRVWDYLGIWAITTGPRFTFPFFTIGSVRRLFEESSVLSEADWLLWFTPTSNWTMIE